MDLKFSKVTRKGPVTIVTLSRPEVYNALHTDAHFELQKVFDDFSADPEQWIAIVTGSGDKAFCAGNDLKWQAAGGKRGWDKGGFAGLTARFDCDKPIIAAVNGDAIGLAATHALLSDITVMAEEARIGDTHVSRVGLVAGDGGTVIWPLLIGINKAKEFLIRGTLLNGKEAERVGLVNHVVPRAQVLSKAREIAIELANGPTWAIRWTKLSINQIVKDRVNMLLEASMALEQVTFDTADHKEATMSFKEKRKPKFGQA